MTELQKLWVRRLEAEFGPLMTAPHVAPDGNVRIVLTELVIVVTPMGRCFLEIRTSSPVPDLLDSDGPDYNPDAYVAQIDLARKAARENR